VVKPALLVERIRIQAAAAHVSPERLLLAELIDHQRTYLEALEILHRNHLDGTQTRSAVSSTNSERAG